MRWTQEQYEAWTRQRGSKAIASPAAPQKARRAKFNNRKVTDEAGNEHASQKQFRRWQELQLRERAGEIRSLRREVPFALVVGGVLVCTYVADHVYELGAATIVEDVKSEPTRKLPVYRIKKRLMKAIHNIEVQEV